MKVHGHIHVLEVAFARRVTELPVVPVHHGDAVCLALRQIVGEVISDPGKS